MIFVDFETELEEVKHAPMLKKLTGANAMISEMALPPVNDKFIAKHIASGAILYRVVTTAELNDIKVEDLLVNLSKMIELGCKTWQCILVLDSSHTLLDYDNCIGKIDSWVEHGGASMFTYGYPVMYYLAKREAKFLATAEQRKTIIVPRFGPRTELVVNKDWTVTLATFPYIGYTGAQAIKTLINNAHLGDDLLTAMIYLTDENELKKSDKQWSQIRKAAREWVGLPDGFNLDLQFSGNNLRELEDK